MSLYAFVFFCLGFLLEALYLFLRNNPFAQLGRLKDYVIPLTIPLFLAGILCAIFALSGTGQIKTSLDDTIPGIIFMIFLLFLLFAGFAAILFLPKITERTLIVVQLLLFINQLQSNEHLNILSVLLIWGIPLVGIGILVIQKKPLAPILKAIVYLWYLICLIIQGFQSETISLFSQPDVTIFQAYMIGTLFFFLPLHCLLALRLFIMVSSCVLPRNRALLTGAISGLFLDEQIQTLPFAIVCALLIFGWGILQILPVSIPPWLTSFFVIICVQFLLDPRFFHMIFPSRKEIPEN